MIPALVRGYFFGPVRLAVKIALAVLLLVGVALIYLSWAVDLNGYKPEIEKRASALIEEEVVINGDIEWGLHWLSPQVKAGEVRIGKTASPDAEIESLALSLPLRELISGGVFHGEKPAALRVSAEGVKYQGKKIGDITLPVRFDSKDGITVDPLAIDIEDGGELKARITYRDAELSADISAEDVDYGFLVSGASGGDIEATVHLAGTGASVEALGRSLKGTVSVNGGKGRISGDALRLWSGDLLSRILTGSRSHTDIACLIVEGKINHGVFVPEQAVLDSDAALVTARGQVDIGRQRLDLLLSPRPKDTALISLATPIRVKGPWGNPRVGPDQRAVLGKVGGLVLGVVAPPAALLGFAELGDSRSPCAKN